MGGRDVKRVKDRTSIAGPAVSIPYTHSAVGSILAWTGVTLIPLHLAVLPLPPLLTYAHIRVLQVLW